MGEGRRRERGADRGADTNTELIPSELQPVCRRIIIYMMMSRMMCMMLTMAIMRR